jgi:Dullard-like phosphatase family protein
MDMVQIPQARDSIIKASEKIEDLKLSAKQQLPPLYGVGGTAIGGYGALQQVKAPYLPQMEDGKEYCLVLDMDETLLHYYEQKGEGYVRVRPGCEKFLKEMSELYEVCIFTAAMQDYADWALDSNKLGQYIKHRMYRQHASPEGMVFVKDLSRIGRPLNKTIIVDNVAENFMKQPDNGIFIKSWFDDQSDTALYELAPLLKCKLPLILTVFRNRGKEVSRCARGAPQV